MSEVPLKNLMFWLFVCRSAPHVSEDDDIGRQKKYAPRVWVRIALALLMTRIDQRIVFQSYWVKHERRLTPPTLMTG